MCSLTFGVPQSSVVGPLDFSVYTIKSLTRVIQSHSFFYNYCSEDTQPYISTSPVCHKSTISQRVFVCLLGLFYWIFHYHKFLTSPSHLILVKGHKVSELKRLMSLLCCGPLYENFQVLLLHALSSTTPQSGLVISWLDY